MPETPEIALVVAMTPNHVIGNNNQLPWHLPNDLRHFKHVTLGHPIVMGRKTYESIGRPLPGRDNVVVTRQRDWTAEGVTVTHELDEALGRARTLARACRVSEVMVIGGAEIFGEVMARADRLYLTIVQTDVEGDAYFPPLNPEDWVETERQDFGADDRHRYDYSFRRWERVKSS